MYRKHIKNLISVGCKYFFDLDYRAVAHSFIVLLVLGGIAKLLWFKVGDELQDGLLTVKEDALSIKNSFAGIKDNWASSNLHTTLTGYVHGFREQIANKISAFYN